MQSSPTSIVCYSIPIATTGFTYKNLLLKSLTSFLWCGITVLVNEGNEI